jgi:curved DNA-binding protein CbpA
VSSTRDPYDILQISPSAVPEVIEAAYHALALLHHPDRSSDPNAPRAMAELNWAYRTLRGPTQGDVAEEAREPIAVEPAPFGASLMERVQEAAAAAIERDLENPANVTLDFGRYAGMNLGAIAKIEPAYLEWLRRHSSGLRYRHQIDALLSTLYARRAPSVE